MTDREIMQQALEALELYADYEGATPSADSAITALRERLAQLVIARPCKIGGPCVSTESGPCACRQLPTPTSPVATQPEQCEYCKRGLQAGVCYCKQPEQWEQFYPDMGKPDHEWLRGECIKCGQVMGQPEPEPVAWIDEFGNVFPLGAQRGPKWLNEPMKPLYTTPPRRAWVGLTDSEFDRIWCAHHDDNCKAIGECWDYERAIEAKLREKNSA